MTVPSSRAFPGVLAAAALFSVAPACAPATATEGPTPPAVLFIGNSLTAVNDLPNLVARVAEADHHAVRVAMVTRPNLAVIDHVNGASDAVARIDGEAWTFVVLQQGPTPAGVCRDTLILAAMRLSPRIRSAGGRPALFLPWSRQAYPQALESAGQSATLAARAVGGVVVPVGVAWNKALDADRTAPLYGPDGYHPAPAGSLLAALTFYDRLFGRDVRTIAPEALATLPAPPLPVSGMRALAAAAHAASAELPPDPPEPAPADTTRPSTGGGPC